MLRTLLLLVFVSLGLPVKADEAVASHQVSTGVMSRHEAAWIFTLRTRYWSSDGARITVYYLPIGTDVHRSFVRDVLRMSPVDYTRLLNHSVNAGFGAYIKEVPNISTLVARVNSTPYSVGALSADQLLKNEAGLVKTIRIVD